MDELLINVTKIYRQENIRNRTIKMVKDLKIPAHIIGKNSGIPEKGISQWLQKKRNYNLDKLLKLDLFLKKLNY